MYIALAGMVTLYKGRWTTNCKLLMMPQSSCRPYVAMFSSVTFDIAVSDIEL